MQRSGRITMASGGSNPASLDQTADTSFDDHRGRYCSVCYQRYAKDGRSVPRILICGHSFCTGCLGRLISKPLRGFIRCPACKTDTKVPGLSNDVTKLAKNFAVVEILESIDEERAASRASIAAAASGPKPPVCEEHENEPKKVYCLTDSELICIYCQVYTGHNTHDCQLVGELAKDYRELLRNSCEELQSNKNSIFNFRELVNNTASAVRLKEEEVTQEITHHFEWLRRKLQKREIQVKLLLKNRTAAKVELLDKQKRTITDLINRCAEQYEECQNVLGGADHEVVLQKDALQSNIEALTEQVILHETSPCTRDDLVCNLDADIITQHIATHGQLMNGNTRTGEAILELHDESSTPSGESSVTPGFSDTTSETSEDHDMYNSSIRHIASASGHVADLIVLEDDDDDVQLEQDNNSVAPKGAVGVVGGATGGAAVGAVGGAVGGTVRGAFGGSGDMTCRACGSPHRAVRGSERRSSRRCRHGYNARPTNLPNLDVLDMDVSIRQAWSNENGWSASEDNLIAATATSTPVIAQTGDNQPKRDQIRSRLVPARTSSPGGQSASSEPLEIPVPQRRSRSSDNLTRQATCSSSRRPRDMKCSVYNCTTGSSTCYVKCKNCTRLFCQQCTTSSNSARRCYKRPRGHSFVFLTADRNASANNNQISFVVPHGSGDDGHGWQCENCFTFNRLTQRSHRRPTCLGCGRQNRNRADGQRQERATTQGSSRASQGVRSSSATEGENTAQSDEGDSVANEEQ